MSSADRYATLSEIWGADSQYGQPVTTSTYNLTSPTCNPGSGGAGAAPTQQPWCDLYNNGYNREVDSIMDMYTPGDSIPADVRYDPKKGKGGVLGPGLSGPLCFSDGDKETILPFEMSMYSAGLSYAPFEVRSSSKKNMSRDSSCRNNKGRRGEDNEDADDVTTERDDEYNDEFQKSSKYRSSRRNQIVENDFDLDFDQLNQYATYQAGPKRCAPRKERSVTNPNTTTTTTTPTNTNTTNTNTTNHAAHSVRPDTVSRNNMRSNNRVNYQQNDSSNDGFVTVTRGTNRKFSQSNKSNQPNQPNRIVPSGRTFAGRATTSTQVSSKIEVEQSEPKPSTSRTTYRDMVSAKK